LFIYLFIYLYKHQRQMAQATYMPAKSSTTYCYYLLRQLAAQIKTYIHKITAGNEYKKEMLA